MNRKAGNEIFFFLCGMIYERQYVKCMDMINQRGIIENTLSYNVTQWMRNLAIIARMGVLLCMYGAKFPITVEVFGIFTRGERIKTIKIKNWFVF